MNNHMLIGPETIAHMIESQYEDLAIAAEEVGAAHAEWKPLGKGRTILNQLQECALQAERVLGTLNGQVLERPTPDEFAKFGSFEESVAACRELGVALAAKLRSLSEEELLKTYSNQFGEFSTIRSAVGTYWNASYHEGAITYIGTLVDKTQE